MKRIWVFAFGFLFALQLSAQVPTGSALTSCVRVFNPADQQTDLIKSAVSQDVGEAARVALIRRQLQESGQDRSPVQIPSELQAFRANYLSYFKASRDIRENIVRVLEADLRMRSYKLANRIFEAAPAAYDIVLIGAGIHGAIAAAEIMRTNPNLKILLIESTDTAASTFRYAGDVLSLNSSNRPSGQGRPPLPGQGNINELAGLPVQVTDLSALRYSAAKDLGDALLIGLYALQKTYQNVDVLLNTKVGNALPASEGAQTLGRTNLQQGVVLKLINEDGSESLVATQRVGVTTGLGQTTIPETLKQTLTSTPALGTAARNKVPKVATVEDIVRLLAQSNDPKAFFKNAKIGVAGTGDNAKIVIEFLMGLAQPAAYGFSDAQTPGPQKIFWINQDRENCEAYIADTRSRYAAIGSGFRSASPSVEPLIEAVQGRVVNATLLNQREANVRAVLENNQSVDVDYLILATGLQGNLREVLGPYFNVRNGSDADFIASGAFRDLNLATSVSNNQQTRVSRISLDGLINLMGAGFNLPEESELLGIIQNKVSLFNNVPRTVAAARNFAENMQPRAVGLTKNNEINIAAGSSAYEVTNLSDVRSTGTDMVIYLRTVLVDILGRVRGDRDGELRIEFSYDPERDVVYAVSSTHNIEQPVTDMLSTRDVFNTLRQIFQSEMARSLTVTVPLQSNRANLANLALTFGEVNPTVPGTREPVINNSVPLRSDPPTTQ